MRRIAIPRQYTSNRRKSAKLVHRDARYTAMRRGGEFFYLRAMKLYQGRNVSPQFWKMSSYSNPMGAGWAYASLRLRFCVFGGEG